MNEVRLIWLALLIAACGSAQGENIADASPDAVVAKSVAIEPAAFSFAGTTLGEQSSEETFTVTNTGDATATLTLATSGDTGEFIVSPGDCADTSLTAGASCTFTARFAPQSDVDTQMIQVSVRDSISAATTVVSIEGEVLNPKLTVSLSGNGSITRTPASSDACGNNCFRHPPGTIRLMPVPDTGYAFSKWTSGCAGSGACQVSLDGSKTVTGEFGRLRSLTVTPGIGNVKSTTEVGIDCGDGANQCSADFLEGKLIRFEVTPPANGQQILWNFNGTSMTICRNNTSCTLTIAAQSNTLNVSFGL